jgi:hypothetical protein
MRCNAFQQKEALMHTRRKPLRGDAFDLLHISKRLQPFLMVRHIGARFVFEHACKLGLEGIAV